MKRGGEQGKVAMKVISAKSHISLKSGLENESSFESGCINVLLCDLIYFFHFFHKFSFFEMS